MTMRSDLLGTMHVQRQADALARINPSPRSKGLSPSPRSNGLTDRQEYRLLFAVTFVIFLVAIVVTRLLPVLGGNHSSAGNQPAGLGPLSQPRSLFAEAKAAGYSALAFAFMG